MLEKKKKEKGEIDFELREHRFYHLIRHQVISEKADIALKNNKYVFVVRTTVCKEKIKRAIEQMFDVKVASVNTMLYKPVNIVLKNNRRGKTSLWKKAIISLQNGYNINLFTGDKK